MAINFNIYLMSMRCGRKKWLIKKKNVLRIYVKTIYVVAELMAKIKPMKSMWFAVLACFVCQVLVDLLPAFTAHWICTDWFHQNHLESLFLAQDIVMCVMWSFGKHEGLCWAVVTFFFWLQYRERPLCQFGSKAQCTHCTDFFDALTERLPLFCFCDSRSKNTATIFLYQLPHGQPNVRVECNGCVWPVEDSCAYFQNITLNHFALKCLENLWAEFNQ